MNKLIDFSKYCSIKIGPILPVEIIQNINDIKENFKIIGFGNNLIISPNAKNLAILGENFNYITEMNDLIEIGGATSSSKIYHYFKKNNLSGLEFLSSLPGSLGGLIKMNAGMKEYEIKDILDSVCINGEWINVKDLGLSYRKSNIIGIILAARFKKIKSFRENLIPLFKQMRSTHPKEPSCGSCFKNPQGDFAGRLLEEVGLRGYQEGGVGFSQKHSNFLVNLSRGNFEEIIKIIELAEKKVFENYGIKLEREIIIVE